MRKICGMYLWNDTCQNGTIHTCLINKTHRQGRIFKNRCTTVWSLWYVGRELMRWQHLCFASAENSLIFHCCLIFMQFFSKYSMNPDVKVFSCQIPFVRVCVWVRIMYLLHWWAEKWNDSKVKSALNNNSNYDDDNDASQNTDSQVSSRPSALIYMSHDLPSLSTPFAFYRL